MHQTSTTRRQPETLAEQTTQLRDDFIGGLSTEAQKIVGGAFERLINSDAGDHAVNANDLAPDFVLPNVRGGQTRLTTLLQHGPVVLNFYRGGWCPFCNLEFRSLQQQLAEIRQLGATLVGISPETPDNSLTTVEKNELEFDVLSDIGNAVSRRYGLVMKVDETMRPLYLEWDLDITRSNGDDSWELPIPAIYVIDVNAQVRAAYVNKDYTQRMEPSDIIAALSNL